MIYFKIISINYELELVWLLGIFLLPNYLMIDILTSGFIAFKNFKIFNFFQISQFGLTLIAIIIASNLGIKDGATIVVLTMLICSIPFHVFKSFLNNPKIVFKNIIQIEFLKIQFFALF